MIGVGASYSPTHLRSGNGCGYAAARERCLHMAVPRRGGMVQLSAPPPAVRDAQGDSGTGNNWMRNNPVLGAAMREGRHSSVRWTSESWYAADAAALPRPVTGSSSLHGQLPLTLWLSPMTDMAAVQGYLEPLGQGVHCRSCWLRMLP